MGGRKLGAVSLTRRGKTQEMPWNHPMILRGSETRLPQRMITKQGNTVQKLSFPLIVRACSGEGFPGVVIEFAGWGEGAVWADPGLEIAYGGEGS